MANTSQRAATEAEDQATTVYTDSIGVTDSQAINDREPVYVPSELLRAMPGTQGPGDPYTPAQRYNAALIWSVTGSIQQTHEQTGITYSTIRMWSDQPWWQLALKSITGRANRETEARFQGVLDRSLREVTDRLDHGDVVLSGGQERRLPIKAKDAAFIMVMAYDKLALIRGGVTSRTERIDLNAIRHRLGTILDADPQPAIREVDPKPTQGEDSGE